MKKYLFPIITLVICFAVVGTTFAWLVDKTAPLENTFTVGDINITLVESETLDLKMIPGKAIAKDPKVTVLQNSEDCWLFVKLEKANSFDTYMEYTMATGWTALAGVDGVYYRKVTGVTADAEFDIISGNTVTVRSTVTKTDLATANASQPKLTVTAYAIQLEGFNADDKVDEAWAAVTADTTAP